MTTRNKSTQQESQIEMQSIGSIEAVHDGLQLIGELDVEQSQLFAGGPGIVFGLDELSENDNRDADPDFICSENGNDSSGSEENPRSTPDPNEASPVVRKKRKVYTNRRTPSSRNSSGRKKDPIWDNFEEEPCGTQGRPKYRCVHCWRGKLSGEVKRLKQHHAQCRKAEVFEINPQSPISTASTSSHSFTQSPKTPESSNPSRGENLKQSTLQWISKTSRDDKQKLDESLAKFVFSTNSPFNIVNNQEFKDFLRQLRPSYTPPSAKVVGGTLLDAVYTQIKQEVVAKLQGAEVTMQQDGWSTCQNQPIVAHSVTLGNKNYFISAENTGPEKKTADFCQKLLEDQIENVEKEYNCTAIGCVTDNCNTMLKMRRTIEQRFPDLYFYGCNSHLLNLIGQDITPTDTIQEVIKIQKYFRSHHFEAGSLLQLKGTRPVIPGDTRWNSQVDTLESFLRNHTKYLEVSRDSKCKMPSELRSIVEDIGFFKLVESAVSKLKPVQTALDKLQGDQTTLADAVECWITLRNNEDLKDYTKEIAFKNRMDLAMLPFAVASYMLHPTYRGRDLPDDLFDLGNEWLGSKSPLFVVAAANLKLCDKNFYPASFLDEAVSTKMNPVNWWAAVSGYQRLPIGLSALGQTLMKLPASSAGIERCFSALGRIMSTRRSRLEVEKGYKLCYIFQYYKNQNKDEVYIETQDLD